ncbi:MAG: hypothetical protein RSA92_04800 [Bacteroidaceae bacterium]
MINEERFKKYYLAVESRQFHLHKVIGKTLTSVLYTYSMSSLYNGLAWAIVYYCARAVESLTAIVFDSFHASFVFNSRLWKQPAANTLKNMSKELENAISSYCKMLSNLSSRVNIDDDERLIEIAYYSHLYHEDVSEDFFRNKLKENNALAVNYVALDEFLENKLHLIQKYKHNISSLIR